MHNYFINQLTLMSGLIYFSISRIKAAKVSFNKRCHDLICNTILEICTDDTFGFAYFI